METRIILDLEIIEQPKPARRRSVPPHYIRGRTPDPFDHPTRALLTYYGDFDLLEKKGMIPIVRPRPSNNPLSVKVTERCAENDKSEVQIAISDGKEIVKPDDTTVTISTRN